LLARLSSGHWALRLTDLSPAYYFGNASGFYLLDTKTGTVWSYSKLGGAAQPVVPTEELDI